MREGAGTDPAGVARGETASRFAVVERVLATLVPFFHRWTHGRLPSYARRRMDTGDIVQEAIVGVLRNLDEVRRASHGEVANRNSDPADGRASPLEEAIDSENRRQYRAALLTLADDDQALLVGRIELGLSFEDLALVTKRNSPDAARVATRRAALRLARAMGREPAAGSG